jgi:hypothetical protein
MWLSKARREVETAYPIGDNSVSEFELRWDADSLKLSQSGSAIWGTVWLEVGGEHFLN